jgi:transcriptional regulator with XRE-family HTH domain
MKLDDVSANAEIDGTAMRELRKLAGYSVKGLAEAVNCSAPYISMLETRPDRTCSPELFARICDALHVRDRALLLRQSNGEDPVAA